MSPHPAIFYIIFQMQKLLTPVLNSHIMGIMVWLA